MKNLFTKLTLLVLASMLTLTSANAQDWYTFADYLLPINDDKNVFLGNVPPYSGENLTYHLTPHEFDYRMKMLELGGEQGGIFSYTEYRPSLHAIAFDSPTIYAQTAGYGPAIMAISKSSPNYDGIEGFNDSQLTNINAGLFASSYETGVIGVGEGIGGWFSAGSLDDSGIGLVADGDFLAARFDGDVQFNGTLTGNVGAAGAIKIQTDEGYTNIGALNEWASHFQTDLPQFWFNKKITAVGGAWVRNGVVRLDNNQGYTQLGYMNQWASHLQTDLPKFWINKQIKVIGDVVTTGDVRADGLIYSQGVLIGSDQQLKQDVQPFEYGLDEVMQMNPLTYDYNGKGGTKSGYYNVGLFAQDLQEIAPEFVTEFTHQETEAETGKLKSEKDYLQIYDTGIKYMLVNATKEQQEIIDNQAAKIETLEETLAELKATVATLMNDRPQGTNHQSIRLQDNTNNLEQNQPNPFSNNTLIKYNLQEDTANAVITIYNTTGQVMHQERIAHTGAGEIQLQANSLKAGTYSYTLTIDGRIVDTKQMVITK